ncbi:MULTISPECIES: O-antigen ligase family protein [Enterococcus]|uniref:O-antigen ligase family protein n=1 Tax=Enterococcus TaxID=1350 RepID=UPI000EC93D8B|nr:MULTISPECIES: O-antigen ligase family protein [Enterococcus]HCM85212.1 hypothetical protein [Enterococcus sp.]
MRKLIIRLINLLLILMPYHYYICDVIFKNFTFLNLWRDFLIILIFISSIAICIKNDYRIKISFTDVSLLLFSVITVCYIIISQNISVSLTIGRVYLIPILVYFSCKFCRYTKEEFISLLKALFINTTVISFFGIFQAFILGQDFLININFVGNGAKYLPDSFYLGGLFGQQRVNGTFVAPNTFGLYLSIMIVTFLFTKESLVKRLNTFFSLGMVIMFIALVGTFSRTAWISTLVTIVFFSVIEDKLKLKKILRAIVSIVVVVLLIIILDNVLFDSLIVNTVQHLWQFTFSKKDPSLNGHINSVYDSIEKVINHPLGLGFGQNGPKAANFIMDSNKTESTYFLMNFEVGFLGALLYFIPFVQTAIKGLYKKEDFSIEGFIPKVSFVCLIAFLTLPFSQDYEIMVFAFFFLGIYHARNVYDREKKQLSSIYQLEGD